MDHILRETMTRTTIFLLLFAGFAAMAEEVAVPCSSAEHRQFDFWLGSWTSFSKDGEKQGSNQLEKIMGTCVMQEHWVGASAKFKGTSFNFYDPVKEQWHQTWVDNTGGSLSLYGGLLGESMRLSGARKNRKGEAVTDRITWTPLEDGRVRQYWQFSSDDGESWTDVFDGYYERDEGKSSRK
ncbi:MAG: hypothetical protein CMQ20_02190 [Gammaproteobacteria bacterium]|jgi:hypothetical protein|nr:hypothetical protein [Gammaproteobacteria bacterium]|tara:strand:- start:1743 stop:2288 length:546 start_codon:yes stop_codon:yes gene_type:complete